MAKKWTDVLSRPVSGTERIWLAADMVSPPFVNQMVLEGEGIPTPGGGSSWDQLLESVAAAQPGIRVRLKGVLSQSRWVADGPYPRFREVDGSGWDGNGPDGAWFLQEPLDPLQGPTSELILVHGDPTRLVVRTHHGSMDGAGTILFAKGIFAALRGEPLPAVVIGMPNDEMVARDLDVPAEPSPRRNCVAPTGKPRQAPFGVTWKRIRVQGINFHRVSSQIAVALARHACLTRYDNFRVDIPVDLRRLLNGLRSSANLTGLIRIDISEHLHKNNPLESVALNIQESLNGRSEAAFTKAASFARWVPISQLARMGRQAANKSLKDGIFSTSATLSNLGRIDLAHFSGRGFQAQRAFFIPPGSPGLPLFVTLVGDREGVEFCASAPNALATDGRLDSVLMTIASALSDSLGQEERARAS